METINCDVLQFKTDLMARIIPIFSNAQVVESGIKDIVFCKQTDHEESMTSCIVMMWSYIISSVTYLTKKNPDFVSRKRTNEEATESFDNKIFNYNMLNRAFNFFPRQYEDEEVKNF